MLTKSIDPIVRYSLDRRNRASEPVQVLQAKGELAINSVNGSDAVGFEQPISSVRWVVPSYGRCLAAIDVSLYYGSRVEF